MKRRIFISHKNHENSNTVSEVFERALLEKNHNVFLDRSSIEGGMNWRQEIIDNLLNADVAIIVLDKPTAESAWVQREVDIAKLQGISILPVTLHEDFNDVKAAFDRFEINDRQYIHYKSSFDPNVLNKTTQQIIDRIEELSQSTIENQAIEIKAWKKRLSNKRQPASIDADSVIFQHPTLDNIKFHIVTGDATCVDGFDVLVNTENTYMQMARFFETNTLSWAIRSKGALLADDDVSLLEDTVQDELYQQIRLSTQRTLPVTERRIIITSAGHPDSELQETTDYRYIFHAASVRVNLADRKVTPIEKPSMIIENCFKKVREIKRKNGAVLFDREDNLIEVDNHQPITSILFPAFGTGDGGKTMKNAAKEMINCFRNKLSTYSGIDNVTKVGFSVFFKSDREIVKRIFLENGFELVSENTTD